MSREDDVLIQQYFDIFDTDKDGNISKKELKKLLKVLFKKVPEEQHIQQLLREYDADENGTLELREFKQLYYSLPVKPKGESLREMFSKYDKNGDDSLSKDEVRKFLQDTHDENVSEDVVEYLMKQTDVDQDGSVSFAEFCRMFVLCFAEGEQ